MSAAVLLKERNHEIVGVQTHLPLALFSSRVHRDVSKSNISACIILYMYMYMYMYIILSLTLGACARGVVVVL